MSRSLGYLLFLLAFTSVVYAARSNICLATSGAKFYRPLQLYPQDCPNNASNCMASVYNYNAAQFKANGPKGLMPGSNSRESLVYMTQDESDNLDVVVITGTTYKNNVIKTNVEVVGAQTGSASILVADDPTEDTWSWDASTNKGSFNWLLQPLYTDGVVIGHFKFVDNYCFRVQFLPNWKGAIDNIVFLSGTVAAPKRVISKPLVGNSTVSPFFEFCQYPSAIITKSDASCTSLGSASVTAIANGTASYMWTKNSDGSTIGTGSSVSGLQAGEYTVTINVEGCTATRPVTIGTVGVPLSVSHTLTQPTKTQNGKIVLSISGGTAPYSITWKNAANTVIARNVTTINVAAGQYTATVTDGCSTQSLTVTLDAPGTCPAGTFVDGDECTSCPAGTFSSASESTSCTVCPPGTWSTTTKATSCNTCAANTYSGGAVGPCNNCPVSTSSTAGSGVCTPCPIGTDRATGASYCTACPAGSSRCDANALCSACPAGTFAGAGQPCMDCDPGTFTDMSGQTSCQTCAANTYAASGASACSACPAGRMAPAKSSVMMACM